MMKEPKCIRDGYVFVDEETEEWRIKDNAPDWAKKEFKEFLLTIRISPDDDGIVTVY